MTLIPDGYPTGCLPRTTLVGEGEFALYGSDGTPPMLSNRQLDELIPTNGSLLLDYHKHTISQNPQSSCCACAGVGAVKLCEDTEGDGDDEEMHSQASVYRFTGVNSQGDLIQRTRDNGMNIEQCLRVLQISGCCGVDTIDQYDWRGKNWPDDWKEKAALHRVAEAWDCADEQAVRSAIAFGYPIVFGSDGHAIIGIGYDKKGVIILNSWGKKWGDNGIGRWPTRGIPQYGAWALRATTADDAPRVDVKINEGTGPNHERRRRFRRR